ncbi:glycoside hydrolase domain-containing protein [Rhizobium johnstonii]|uniref:glycoside hydrolase domain-containing protein n=1 Tax=Rhizobium johnstonii TaxID=3019933 RepID=UPI003F95BFDF
MSYPEDFARADGWSAADVSVHLNNSAARGFLSLKSNGVRYYASSARPKAITPEEAKFLSKEGFGVLPVFQDSSRNIANFRWEAGIATAKSATEFAKRIGHQPDSRGYE